MTQFVCEDRERQTEQTIQQGPRCPLAPISPNVAC
jgi:hypothetical protein